MQAVRHEGLGITACTVFAKGPRLAGRLLVDGPAALIVRQSGRRTEVALSDPTMRRDHVSVLVPGRPLRVSEAGEGVTVRRVPGGTLVRAATRHAYGRTFTAILH
ncbi:polysaccharide lyase beta-sandwich domain-containing protein [Nonomuraea salmonea]|uniref:polysaccharide lyase beta-sandwich domain-containing protein n=1 Tax=Nonomuraea salmonea TaxID=46181 RepID=UPI003CD05B7D